MIPIQLHGRSTIVQTMEGRKENHFGLERVPM
jgi:hypothetical protein